MSRDEHGDIGHAAQIDAGEREIDAWSISTVHPVTVVDNTRGYPVGALRSQFLLSVHRLNQLPDGDPHRVGDTHAIIITVATPAVMINRTVLGMAPIDTMGGLLRAQFPGGPDDLTARQVAVVVNRAIVTGELPIQGRHVALGFHRGVRLIAMTLHGMSRMSPVESES